MLASHMEFTLLNLALTALVSFARSNVAPEGCNNLSGDADWPTTSQWSLLNKIVGDRLMKTILI